MTHTVTLQLVTLHVPFQCIYSTIYWRLHIFYWICEWIYYKVWDL